jgi:hypothetical protein
MAGEERSDDGGDSSLALSHPTGPVDRVDVGARATTRSTTRPAIFDQP